MLSLNCAVCNSKKLKFLKEQEARTHLSQILLLVPLLFKTYKMNEITNKFLLAGDKFMPEMHLRQSGFTYCACGLFTKDKKRKKKRKKTQKNQDIFTSMN